MSASVLVLFLTVMASNGLHCVRGYILSILTDLFIKKKSLNRRLLSHIYRLLFLDHSKTHDGCKRRDVFWGHLGFLNGTILDILNLHVALMPPTKLWLNPIYGLGDVFC